MNFKSSWCLFIGDETCPALETKVQNENEDPNFYLDTPFNLSGNSFT